MISFLRKNYEFLFVVIYSLFHLYFFNLDPINDEYIFYTGAEFIKTQKIEIIGLFFEFNANTLGFSYLIYILSYIFNINNFYFLGKFLASVSYIFLYFSLLNFLKIFKIKKRFEFILLILFCPIIFVYGFRATPDLFSFSLSFFSSSLILIYRNLFIKLLAFVLLSIAFIIKPINGIFLFFIFLYFIYYKKKSFLEFTNLIGLILFLVLVLIFFCFNYKNFSFFILSPNWKNLDISENNFFVNLIYYLGFLNLIIFPFKFEFILKKILSLKNFFIFMLVYFFINIFLFIYIDETLNEINFGFLSNNVSDYVMKFFFGFNAAILIFYFMLFFLDKKVNNNFCIFLIYIISYLLILSNFSPVQRYLMALFPIIYYLSLCQNYSKVVYNSVLFIYLIFNTLILINHMIISDLSKKTHEFLINNNILNQTHPGYFGQHSLSKFTTFYDSNLNKIDKKLIFSNSKKYIIVDKIINNKQIIFEYSSKILFINKDIFVQKNN